MKLLWDSRGRVEKVWKEGHTGGWDSEDLVEVVVVVVVVIMMMMLLMLNTYETNHQELIE